MSGLLPRYLGLSNVDLGRSRRQALWIEHVFSAQPRGDLLGERMIGQAFAEIPVRA